MALSRVWIASPNYNSGNNGQRLLVVHSSEGAQTYRDLGNFFASSSSQVSSHVGIDNNSRGTIGEYVKRGNSAWTAGSWNGVAIQAELCTPSGASESWSRNTWLSKDTMLVNLADWLQEESKKTGIPLTALTESQVGAGKWGVCQHRDLPGQTHTDCGPNFPMDYVMDLARGGAPITTEWEPGMQQLVLDAEGRCALVFTNTEADGKHRLRLGCRVPATVRIDTRGDGTKDLQLGLDEGAQGFTINTKYMVLKLDAGGESPIGMCISD